MSCNINTYEILVAQLGEERAYQLCEKLGGTELQVPKKAHKTYRVRQIIKKAMPLIKKDNHKKTRLVKRLAMMQGITQDAIYRIIREVEYGK